MIYDVIQGGWSSMYIRRVNYTLTHIVSNEFGQGMKWNEMSDMMIFGVLSIHRINYSMWKVELQFTLFINCFKILIRANICMSCQYRTTTFYINETLKFHNAWIRSLPIWFVMLPHLIRIKMKKKFYERIMLSLLANQNRHCI